MEKIILKKFSNKSNFKMFMKRQITRTELTHNILFVCLNNMFI